MESKGREEEEEKEKEEEVERELVIEESKEGRI